MGIGRAAVVGRLVISVVVLLAARAVAAAEGPGELPGEDVLRIRLLPPGPGNPRNSEGSLLLLRDGRLLLVYTHFTGGGADASAAHLAARYSGDGGDTWSALAPSHILSPCSPASIKRIPRTGELPLHEEHEGHEENKGLPVAWLYK